MSTISRLAVIEFEGIGPVLFERSQRARHLNITIRPLQGVRVAIPLGLSFEQGRGFVHQKADWIRKNLLNLKREIQQHETFAEGLCPVNKSAAKKRLTERLSELAEKHAFSYNQVSIRNQRTRWGSCSAKNNISLNIKIASLPQDLTDYVILHELVHTRVKNHGKNFWKAMDRLTGDAKAADKALKAYRLTLI